MDEPDTTESSYLVSPTSPHSPPWSSKGRPSVEAPKMDFLEDDEMDGFAPSAQLKDDEDMKPRRCCGCSCSCRNWTWSQWAVFVLALLFIPICVGLLVLLILNYTNMGSYFPPIFMAAPYFTHALKNPGLPGEIVPLRVKWEGGHEGSKGIAYMINYNGTASKCCAVNSNVVQNPRVFNFADPRKSVGFNDGALTCRVYALNPNETLQFTSIEPLIDSHLGIELIHHLDIYACNDKIDLLQDETYNETSRCPALTVSSKKGPCYKLLFAYDRGAKAFAMPAGTAITIGHGTLITRLGLEIHYLLPESWPKTQYASTGVRDISGFRLHVTRGPSLVPTSIGSMAWVNTDFFVPPNRGLWSLEVVYTAPQLSTLLGPDFDASKDGLDFVAAHLHTHNYSVASYLDHMRGKNVVQRMRTHATGGYGRMQTFEELRGLKKVLRGDWLRYTCVYDTSGLLEPIKSKTGNHTRLEARRGRKHGHAGLHGLKLTPQQVHDGVGYSLNAGGEMCAPLLLYTPTQHRFPVLGTNYRATIGHSGPWTGKLEHLRKEQEEEDKRMGL